MRFTDTDVTFPEKGLVLVRGVNSASNGSMSSVGSGKTGFGEALCRALFGLPGRFPSLKRCSYKKLGDLYIRVEAQFKGKPLIVENGYACKEFEASGESLRFTYDGVLVERGRIQQTRDDLLKLLGISQLLAQWTVFVDGDNIRFNKLEQASCVELVMAALQQPRWDVFYDTAKKKSGEFRRELDKNSTRHADAIVQVEKARADLAEAEIDLKRAERAFKEAELIHADAGRSKQVLLDSYCMDEERIKESVSEVRAQLKTLEEERAEQAHALEIELNQADDQMHALNLKRKAIGQGRDAALAEYNSAKNSYNDYVKSAANCPTCLRPLGTLDPKRSAILAKKRDELREEYARINADLAAVDSEAEAVATNRRLISENHRKKSSFEQAKLLSAKNSRLEKELAETRERIRRVELDIADKSKGPSDAAVVEARAMVDLSKKYVESAEKALDDAAAAMTQDKQMQAIVDYWCAAFSPYGIPNMILSEAIDPLNHEARNVSATMTGGTIDVRFSTVRELASGKEKAVLNVEVENKLGDDDFSGSSKGEAGLTNFIIAETLSRVGKVSSNIGFRWYDEIVPNQDPKVCSSIYAYIRNMAERLGILIFLVDHNVTAANYADHILVVEKKTVTVPATKTKKAERDARCFLRWE